MPADRYIKSAEELADVTGADVAVIRAEFEAAARVAGVRDQSEE